MSDGDRKTWGGVAIGCGTSGLIVFVLASIFFIFVGVEGRGRDEEIAFPLALATCVCTFGSLLLLVAGLVLVLKKRS